MTYWIKPALTTEDLRLRSWERYHKQGPLVVTSTTKIPVALISGIVIFVAIVTTLFGG